MGSQAAVLPKQRTIPVSQRTHGGSNDVHTNKSHPDSLLRSGVLMLKSKRIVVRDVQEVVDTFGEGPGYQYGWVDQLLSRLHLLAKLRQTTVANNAVAFQWRW